MPEMPSADTQSSAALEAPLLLIAMPQVLDPFFHRSVVLLAHHDEEGSLGFIVNRATEIELPEILQSMEMAWGGSSGAVAFFGGPVQPQLGTVLFEPHPGQELEGTIEVAPGLSLTQHVTDLQHLASAPPERFRMLLGYAGWGGGQLVSEILRNDWLIAPVTPELVFGLEPVKTWETALASVGVDPEALPSWSTPIADDEGAN